MAFLSIQVVITSASVLLFLPQYNNAFLLGVGPSRCTTRWRRHHLASKPSPSRSLLLSQPNDDDGNDNQNFFEDFDFVIGDKKLSKYTQARDASANLELQARLQQLQSAQADFQSQVLENWKLGHWSVRGCSLDPSSNDNDDDASVQAKIAISSLCSIVNDDSANNNSYPTVLVGRTNGNLCWLQLGGSQDYLATFTNQFVAKDYTFDNDNECSGEDKAAGMIIQQELKREGNDDNDDSTSRGRGNFELLAQLQVGQGAIGKMKVVQDILYFVDSSKPNSIMTLPVLEDGPAANGKIAALDDVHAAPIVAILSNNQNDFDEEWIVSASQNGQVAVWKQVSTTTQLQYQFQIPFDQSTVLLSCDMDSEYLYFGDNQGTIYVYSLYDDAVYKDEPLKTFSVFDNGGVSAICAAGKGSMGRNSGISTKSLLAGSTNGDIRQWELIPRMGSVEFWPKLASQTLPNKAHVFDTTAGDSYTASDSSSAVLALKVVKQDNVILSANAQELFFWDPSSGKPYFDMQGLDFGSTTTTNTDVACVVLSGASIMVTNGMEQYVCVHDFSIDPLDEDDIDDMIDTNMMDEN